MPALGSRAAVGIGGDKPREGRIALRRITPDRFERRSRIGRLAIVQELQGGFKFGAGRLIGFHAEIFIGAPARRPEDDQQRGADHPILVTLPDLEDLIAAEILINFAKEFAHFRSSVGSFCRVFWP